MNTIDVYGMPKVGGSLTRRYQQHLRNTELYAGPIDFQAVRTDELEKRLTTFAEEPHARAMLEGRNMPGLDALQEYVVPVLEGVLCAAGLPKRLAQQADIATNGRRIVRAGGYLLHAIATTGHECTRDSEGNATTYRIGEVGLPAENCPARRLRERLAGYDVEPRNGRPKEYLIRALRALPIDTRDDEDFRALVAFAVERIGIRRQQLASRFAVSLPTVERWLAGKNAPHPVARESVRRCLYRSTCRIRLPKRSTAPELRYLAPLGARFP